ncbi:TIGR03085 family protein [Brachybacterium avium]|uniref:TIGR03085 family protein n=2 Tax=Brachybacterium avium TaxID=2017485 RepID=A0A220U8C3_9MICO|nr:TIGR03085 family protein [Brachybacterium avium]
MHERRHDEREAFARTFLTHGPEAPTILPGWDAAELLEHLLLREGAPHLRVGSHLPGALGARAQRALDALRASSWQERVERFRQGPGRLSPIGRIDALSGQGELLIHHEDLRRAQLGWEPRQLPAEAAADAWRAVGLMAPLAMRVRAEVTLVSPLGGRQLRSRRAVGSLRVHGDPLELLLWVSGRDEVARVRVHGDQVALQALREGRRGL